ncbi:MAG: putative metal-binding motif-containing protein [Myxococcales bacterium]|nr:putative metal-binding motif-containing protein [Myxococcales bacterium]
MRTGQPRPGVMILFLLLAGCGGDPGPNDGGQDGGDTSCTGMADGTACGAAGSICLASACVVSVCGDGFVDTARGEQCDDGNDVAFDGCDPPGCTITCGNDTDCDNGRACDGVETCDVATRACAAGIFEPDGTACSSADVTDGVCGAGVCREPGCGNGVVEAGESCDDGANGDPDDGCKDNCSFSCLVDPDCDDGNVCTGEERCDMATHVCTAGAVLDCDDGDACTADACDPLGGCVNALMDEDRDGYAPDTIPGCGTDCDDGDPSSNPGAAELCDAVDHDCDGNPDPPTIPRWFPDCDGDGYARLDAASMAMQTCAEPAPLAGCAGGWTSRAPVAGMPGTIDCDDGAAAVRPGETELPGDLVDQNCDGSELCYLDADDDGYRRIDGRTIVSADADCDDMGEAPATDPATDCDDGAATTYPMATELCNGLDDNCSGAPDETLSCVRGTSVGCVACGFAGTRTCDMTCEYGGCGGFSFNTAFMTGPDLMHACGLPCDADWCSDESTADCFVVSGGPGRMVPPGRYEAEFYGGYSGMWDFYVDLEGTEAASMLGWVAPSGFPRVIVPFTVTGCATASVRLFAHPGARMRLYTLTIRRVGD